MFFCKREKGIPIKHMSFIRNSCISLIGHQHNGQQQRILYKIPMCFPETFIDLSSETCFQFRRFWTIDQLIDQLQCLFFCKWSQFIYIKFAECNKVRNWTRRKNEVVFRIPVGKVTQFFLKLC